MRYTIEHANTLTEPTVVVTESHWLGLECAQRKAIAGYKNTRIIVDETGARLSTCSERNTWVNDDIALGNFYARLEAEKESIKMIEINRCNREILRLINLRNSLL